MSDVVKGQRSGVNIEDFERKLYASSNSGQAVEDPLAELSRLVGKADPFGNVFANAATGTRAAPSPSSPPVAAPVPPPMGRPVSAFLKVCSKARNLSTLSVTDG